MRTFVTTNPSSGNRRAGGRRSGITLLTVLLVLATIAVLAGWAIPKFFAQPAVTLDNAAALLVRDIRTAQNRAMWSGVDAYVQFDADGGGYRIVDRNGRALERLGALGDWAQRYEDGGVFQGVHATRIDCGADRALLFDAKKRNWEGGEIELAFGDETRVVRVSERQGEVTVFGAIRSWDADPQDTATRSSSDPGASRDADASDDAGH